MTRSAASNRAAVPWQLQRVSPSPALLGMNYPWLNLHNGSSAVNWLNVSYDSAKVEADLALIASLGFTQIRAFTQLESVMHWDGSAFSLNSTYQANLDDFLTRANNHGLAVCMTMGDGNYSGSPSDLDGKFRWALIQSSPGLTTLMSAITAFVNAFKAHTNIMFWGIANEPYANLTWSPAAIGLSVTKAQCHTYLQQAYATIKSLVGNAALVGFSDYEEEEQSAYRTFSDATNRASYIDDCTDVYAMHVYRPDYTYIADFRAVTNKLKWCLECGNLNYLDPTASSHPIPGHNELFNTEVNYSAVAAMVAAFVNNGFVLVMPWAMGNNNGMFLHNADGSHTTLKLPLWLQEHMSGARAVSGARNPA